MKKVILKDIETAIKRRTENGWKNMKKISIATQVNRNFYKSLRNRGRSHYEIMKMIQDERKEEFLKDIEPIVKPLEPNHVLKAPFWKKLFL